MQVQSLGHEDSLQGGMATRSVFLPGKFQGAWQAIVHRASKSQTRLKGLSIQTDS